MQDLVSVIITAYKAEGLIHRSVTSVLNQTYKDIEIIVISDDQKDYEKILFEKHIKDKRIKHISTGRVGAGQANALNLGIEKAQSNFIANLDFDDEFHPERIEILLPLVKKYGAATSGLEFIDEETGKNIETISATYEKDNLNFKEFIVCGIHTFMNLIFDRNKIRSRFITDYSLAMDIISTANMFDYIDFFGYSPEKLIRYYRRNGSLCNSENAVKNFIGEYKKGIRELKENIIAIEKSAVKRTLIEWLEAMVEIEKEYLEDLSKDPNNKFNDTLKRRVNYLKESVFKV